MTATRTSPSITRQGGLTLIETLVALSIFALVVGGALALFGSASSSQNTTQFTSDLNALRAATKSLYFGQGGYGSAVLNDVLINGKKVPTTMIPGTGTPRTINHSLNGLITVTGNNASFTVQATNIPTDVCIGLAAMTGWDSVKIGAAPVHTTAVSPTAASTECASTNPTTLLFTSS